MVQAGDVIPTSLFGTVTISEVFGSEAEARAAGYVADAHVVGGHWPYGAWKVLGRGGEFAAARLEHMETWLRECGTYERQSAGPERDPADLRESGGVDRVPGEGLPALRGPVQVRAPSGLRVRGEHDPGPRIPGQVTLSDILAGLEREADGGGDRGGRMGDGARLSEE